MVGVSSRQGHALYTVRPLMPAALRSALGISSPMGAGWVEHRSRFDTPLAPGDPDPRFGTVSLGSAPGLGLSDPGAAPLSALGIQLC